MIDFEHILKENNLKITNQRIEVLNLIDKLDIHATLTNIKKQISIDKSTIYRIIEKFLEKNIIEQNINYQKQIYYTIKKEHKHYIKCIKCNNKQEIEICPINKIETQGYKIINHKVEIDAICNKCQNNN